KEGHFRSYCSTGSSLWLTPDGALATPEGKRSTAFPRRPGGKRAYSIVVPTTYNDRLNIALIVYLIFKHLPDVNFEIIIVDDGSPDGTQDIVKQLQQVYGEDHVLLQARPRKLGLGDWYRISTWIKACLRGVCC
ncbi:unnamed protein product, partial [Urochloa humidicola]